MIENIFHDPIKRRPLHCKVFQLHSFCSALRQHVFNYLIWLSMQMMWKLFEKSLNQLFCNFDLKEMARVQWTCKTSFNWTCSSLVQTITNQKNGYILFFFFYFLFFSSISSSISYISFIYFRQSIVKTNVIKFSFEAMLMTTLLHSS
jgi:hypothetical protein